ncbi:anti-sigma factor family protein [Actinophytocola sp.]|uniref:anti-sigma factor family protein n=1 Tax=Actinophytocola sp. TaxID=1872138 RepID=UPI003D6A332E
MNPVEHDPSLLAAYALGGLDPAEQDAVQAHVVGCLDCQLEVREFTNLRLALDEVPPEAFMDGPPAGGDLLLQKTLRRARAEMPPQRRRGWAPMAITVAAAVALVAAVSGGIVIGRETAPEQVAGGPTATVPSDAREAKVTDPNTGATMAVTMVPKEGWVTLHADVTGIKAGLDCELLVVPRRGEPVLAGSWRVSKLGEAEGTPLDGSALVDPSAVKAVEVVTTDGQKMVSVRI